MAGVQGLALGKRSTQLLEWEGKSTNEVKEGGEEGVIWS